MELTSFSPMPYRPCLLLKCAKATILLDAAVNLEPLAAFYPYKSTGRFEPPTLHGVKTNNKSTLDQFIDATPEVQPALLENVDVENIDAILISNLNSLFGLPYITERNEFHGAVYCTIPTKELGGLAMHELYDYLTHVRSREMTDEMRKTDLWKRFTNCTVLYPTHWRPVFTYEEVERSLSRIVPISLGETKLINGAIKCTAYSSGYALGSCNWLIELDSTKLGYIANSSVKSTHMRPYEEAPFKSVDYLIITSLTLSSDSDPYKSCSYIRNTMANALNKGGNVLFPVNPTGYVFDLLEVIFGALEEYKISRDVPVYFVSPAAASTIAFINIFTEWLKKEKAVKVYNPEEPFAFNDLMRENRIKVYDSVYGTFSREYKSPCIVLTGHPSLHIGSVVNFLELWGQDSKSVIITTDPEYPMKEMYKPYRNLQIRAYDYPIETRLDMAYINGQLQKDLKPKTLIVPKEYATSLDSNLTENSSIVYNNMVTFSYGDEPKVFKNLSRKRALIQDDLLKLMKMDFKHTKTISMCNLRGFLSTYDNDYEILSTIKGDALSKPPTLPMPKLAGVLTPESLIKALKNRGVLGEHGTATAGECSIVRIPKLKAEVRIAAGGLSTRIRCSSAENRKRIQRFLHQCLEEL